MAVENETAEQVVRMVLQGSEVVLRLSGEAAINVAKMIYAALQGDLTTKGKATLWEFLKSGKDQKVFKIPDEYLKAFTTASKKYGFPFVVLKDKNNRNRITDIMVYATDASKVDRVIENLKLTVQRVETIKPEIKINNGVEYIQPLGMQLKVPLELIDNIPPLPEDKKRLAQIQKFASKMKTSGPQIAEPVGLLCKEDGHYEVLPGEGAKRLMALRLAGYSEAVADISVPKDAKQIDVRAENLQEERNPINPTMARMLKDPASGQDLGSSLLETGEMPPILGKKPSVRSELERCKQIADGQNAVRAAQRAMNKVFKGGGR
ncbi:MAG: PcfB family protein [Saccharofermentans sp.]|nr:PcfB family protein [Saccharofermentans sp.]